MALMRETDTIIGIETIAAPCPSCGGTKRQVIEVLAHGGTYADLITCLSPCCSWGGRTKPRTTRHTAQPSNTWRAPAYVTG